MPPFFRLLKPPKMASPFWMKLAGVSIFSAFRFAPARFLVYWLF
jgi:hypothetical protein